MRRYDVPFAVALGVKPDARFFVDEPRWQGRAIAQFDLQPANGVFLVRLVNDEA